MKKACIRIFSIILVLVAFLQTNTLPISANSSAYIYSQKWNKHTLYFYFDTTPSADIIPKSAYVYWNVEVPPAFEFWNSWLETYQVNIKFVQTNKKSKADVIVKYGTGPSWAHVDLEKTSTTIKKATITLDDFEFYNLKISDDDIRKIIKHEIGHTLGLRDIAVNVANKLNIKSIMVNDIYNSRHVSYPTYEFDRVNLKKNY